MIVAAALYGATFIGIVSLTLSLAGRRFATDPSRAMAGLTLSYGAAQMLAPALAGGIADATGDFSAALYLAAVVMACGTTLLAFMDHRYKDAQNLGHRTCHLADIASPEQSPPLPAEAEIKGFRPS